MSSPRRRTRARSRLLTGLLPLAAAALLLSPGCDDGNTHQIECIDWDAALGACPDRDDALDEFQLSDGCSITHLSVDSDGELDNGQCCYEVTISTDCCFGNC
ncbi:MAG: hypothetical protein R3B70_02850 [Polyangiaceae bacterium]